MTITTDTQRKFNNFLNRWKLTGEDRSVGMILLAGSQIGANASAISKATGIPVHTVEAAEVNLRKNKVWVGEETVADWNAEPIEFLMHILVAQGRVQTQHAALS
jgi:hypothetical protein